MINHIWRQQVQSLRVALQNGALPLTKEVLLELVGQGLYNQFWQAQFEAEDEDEARYQEVKAAGVPKTVKGYLSNRDWLKKALADRHKLEKRHALQLARKQALIDDLIKSARDGYAALSDDDKAYLWPLGRDPQGELAEGIPGPLPGHLVGDPNKPEAEVRAQIAILEAALAADAQQP